MIMTYEVIKDFSDSTDNKFVYRAGDTFPRSGLSVSEARIAQLLSGDNMRGVPLIREGLRKATEDVEEAKAGVSPPSTQKPAKRPRKRKGE